MHGNKKIKLGNTKYRVSKLLKMSDAELQEIWTDVQKDIDMQQLDWLYFQYKENLQLKEQGLPYGMDLIKNEDEDGKEQERPII